MPRTAPSRGCLAAGLAAMLLAPLAAGAQGRSPFTEATGLTCAFPVMATGTWARGGDASMKTTASDLSLEFTGLSVLDGSAHRKGMTGNLLITVMVAGGNLHLVVTNTGGLLHLTSVSTDLSRPGFYKAVHSRHELTESAVVIPGFTSRPEQYLGGCAVTK